VSFKDSCKASLLSDKETPQVFKEYMSKFIDRLDDLYKEAGNSDGFKKSAQKMISEELNAIKGARYEALADLGKAANNKRRIAEFVKILEPTMGKDKAVSEAIRSIFRGANNAIDGGNFSVDTRRRSLLGTMQAHWIKLNQIEMGKGTALDVFLSGDLDEQITKELFELESGKSGGISGSKEALIIAKELNAFNETELKIKQDAGISVSKKRSFVTNLGYDRDKIKSKFRDGKEFAQFMSKSGSITSL